MNTKQTKPTNARVSRRRFLIGTAGLTGAAALSACAAPPAPAAAPSTAAAASTTAPEPTTAQLAGVLLTKGERNGTTEGLDIAVAPLPAEGAYPRTVTDVFGRKMEFKSRPARVAMDTNRYALDELLLLGIAPIAFQVSDSEELAPWTKDALARLDAALVNFNGRAYPTPPNLELLATLKPDLIVMLHFSGGNNTKPEDYELFSLYEKIAPVFFVEYTDLDATRVRMLAEVFALEDKVAEIQERDAALFEAVTPPPADVELAIGFGYKGSAGVSSQIYNGGASELVTLERMGFTIKDYGRPQGERSFDPSEETLTILDADMLWNVAPYPGDIDNKAFETSKIVQNLKVVKEGRYRSLTSDQSQAILFWTPLATPFLVKTLNELVASYKFDAAAVPADGAPAASATGYPRTVTDFFGPVEIKAKPQRIMTYANFDLDTMLALGVMPALISVWEGQKLFPWQAAAKDIPTAAVTSQGPNIEKIVAEGIDLIVITGNNAVWGGAKEKLGTRVPVITLPEGDFAGQLRIVGALLGLEAQAEAQIAEMDKVFASYIPSRIPKTIKAFGTYGDGTYYMFKPAAGLSKMLERFRMPPLTVTTTTGNQDNDPEAVHSISLEKVTELEADLLIGTNYDDKAFKTVVDSPIFKQLAAVKEGRFKSFNNDESTAIAYGSVLTVPMARDLLTRALAT